MRKHLAGSLLLAAVFGAAAFLMFPTPKAAAQQADQVPAEAREWLARDQPRIWGRMLRTGEQLFKDGSCTNCHGEGGSGTDWAPDLTDNEWVQSEGDLQGIADTIFWGVRRRDFADPNRRFEMNPAGGMDVTWDEVRALAAYVWTLSHPADPGRR